MGIYHNGERKDNIQLSYFLCNNIALSQVYGVKRETGKGPSRVLHRNLLLPCSDLPIENPAPAQKSHKNAPQHGNRRSRVQLRLQNSSQTIHVKNLQNKTIHVKNLQKLMAEI